MRFNRHAVYLGAPGARQRCPAHAIGRTEAILVEPMAGGAARSGGRPSGPVLPSGSRSAGQAALPARGLLVTATWGRNRGIVERAIGGRRLGPLAASPTGAARWALARPAKAKASASGVYTGLGFDACSAPSPSTMSAWGSSPYRAVGIYIGGANEGCSQPNLTAAWVSTETAAGWNLIPTYVGLQAGGACSQCATISSSQATAQGTAAAQDAVTHAQALGIGEGSPIYDDMEGYSRTSSNTNAVLGFLAGWTGELHSLGYASGVYSSGDSGIVDLVDAQGTSFLEPDDIWIARWNNAQSTVDPVVPTSDWDNHQRLHQYAGGHNATYGGVTINIDSNYLDGAVAGGGTPIAAACTSAIPDGTFVEVSGLYGVYRIAGEAPLFVSDWADVGGAQPVTIVTQQDFDALCPVPQNGTFIGTTTGVFYRVVGGAALAVTDWTSFGGVQPSITIDGWDIANAGSPASHLATQPASGTIVNGLPSNTYWEFTTTYRTPVGPSSKAVAVNDAALTRFKIEECTAPRLKHRTFGAAKRAIRRAHCTLGKVHRPKHWGRHHKLGSTGRSHGPSRYTRWRGRSGSRCGEAGDAAAGADRDRRGLRVVDGGRVLRLGSRRLRDRAREPAAGRPGLARSRGDVDAGGVLRVTAERRRRSDGRPPRHHGARRPLPDRGVPARLVRRRRSPPDRVPAELPGQAEPSLAPGARRGVPAADPVTGELALDWPVTDRIRTQHSWVTGEYLAQIVLADGHQRGRAGWVPFVVRPAHLSSHGIMVEVPVNTWEAYNNWGGKSLYAFNSFGGDPAVKVSFDRPWAYGEENLTFPVGFEYRLIQFLERNGFPLEYATDLDIDQHPHLLLGQRLAMTIGHGEYWSKRIRDAWDAARDTGHNLAFLGANTGYWQIRYEDHDRTIVEYRENDLDPDPIAAEKTTAFRALDPPRPECELEGVQFQQGGLYPPLINAYTVTAAANPWLTAAGFQPGDVLPGAVRSEWDAVQPGCDVPTPTVLFRYAGAYPADATLVDAPAGGRTLALGSEGFGTLVSGVHKAHCSVDVRAETFLRAAIADLGAVPSGELPPMPPGCVKRPRRTEPRT